MEKWVVRSDAADAYLNVELDMFVSMRGATVFSEEYDAIMALEAWRENRKLEGQGSLWPDTRPVRAILMIV
jgi:hypothetical protein